MKKVIYPAILLIALLFAGNTIYAESCCIGIRGNVDYDPSQNINVVDLTVMVDYLFGGGEDIQCLEEADLNADAVINIIDLTVLAGYLFGGGDAPGICPPDIVEDSVIQDFTVGNVFVSHVTEYNAGGGVIAEGTATTTSVGDTLLADSIWYLIENAYTSTDTAIFANFENGAWSWTDTTTPNAALALKYPAAPGETYSYYDATIIVESVNQVVTVPAGTFTCYYYNITAPIVGTLGKIWCAPNIGIVKAEEYGLNLIWTYLAKRTQLESYTIIYRK